MDRVNELLSQAADQMHKVSQHNRNSDEVRELYRQAALLLIRLGHALEYGPAYPMASVGEDFDKANQARWDQLHVNPEPNRY
jgi:hypothetical protein